MDPGDGCGRAKSTEDPDQQATLPPRLDPEPRAEAQSNPPRHDDRLVVDVPEGWMVRLASNAGVNLDQPVAHFIRYLGIAQLASEVLGRHGRVAVLL